MNHRSHCPPSQESKISSSTDRELIRRKVSSIQIGAKNDTEPENCDNSNKANKSSYKKASERPAAAVARRNARERRRVHTVNQAFSRLKTFVPTLRQKTKRVSKLKILKAAIDYVYDLQDILAERDDEISVGRAAAKNNEKNKICQPGETVQEHKMTSTGQNNSNGTTFGNFDYTESLMEAQVSTVHAAINHQEMVNAEDSLLARYQTLPYQCPFPAALVAGMCNSHGIGMTIPTIPSSTNDRLVAYGGSHLDFVPCHYCGHPVPVTAYGDSGRCDQCAAIASYNYTGSSSSVLL